MRMEDPSLLNGAQPASAQTLRVLPSSRPFTCPWSAHPPIRACDYSVSSPLSPSCNSYTPKQQTLLASYIMENMQATGHDLLPPFFSLTGGCKCCFSRLKPCLHPPASRPGSCIPLSWFFSESTTCPGVFPTCTQGHGAGMHRVVEKK